MRFRMVLFFWGIKSGKRLKVRDNKCLKRLVGKKVIWEFVRYRKDMYFREYYLSVGNIIKFLM